MLGGFHDVDDEGKSASWAGMVAPGKSPDAPMSV
jgi:hypothetical protein